MAPGTSQRLEGSSPTQRNSKQHAHWLVAATTALQGKACVAANALHPLPSTAAPPCWPMLARSGRPLMKWKAVVSLGALAANGKIILDAARRPPILMTKTIVKRGGSSRMQQQPQVAVDKTCNYLRAPANSFNASGGTCPTSFIALAMLRAIRIMSGV